MRNRYGILLLLFILIIMTGCAAPFKPANINPQTGLFSTNVEVDKKHIKILSPLTGVQESNYVFLRTYASYGGNDRFYEFMKDALIKIGFRTVYSERELSQMIIKSGLSVYVTNISDLISLNNLAKITGPYLIVEANVFRVTDTVFRFDLQIIEPLSGDTYLEISRIRNNWFDMDTEINYPILNIIKQWYDESAKIPYEKPKSEPEIEERI